VQWRTSSYCDSAACVTVGTDSEEHLVVHLGDSKDPDGPYLTLSRVAWGDFIETVKAGRFDRR